MGKNNISNKDYLKKTIGDTSYTWHLTHCIPGYSSYRLVAPSVTPTVAPTTVKHFCHGLSFF